MAKKSSNKSAGRPKPLAHTPGLTKKKRRYDCGGKLKKTS